MIDFDRVRKIIAVGLKDYIGVPVIRSSQTGRAPPYPYCSYTITNIAKENKGIWGEYEDGICRQPIIQTWSITVQSDDNSQALDLTMKAHDYFDLAGRKNLFADDIVVQSVGSINNRDNLITIEYEYRHGFDVDFYLMNELTLPESEFVEDIELRNMGG